MQPLCGRQSANAPNCVPPARLLVSDDPDVGLGGGNPVAGDVGQRDGPAEGGVQRLAPEGDGVGDRGEGRLVDGAAGPDRDREVGVGHARVVEVDVVGAVRVQDPVLGRERGGGAEQQEQGGRGGGQGAAHGVLLRRVPGDAAGWGAW